MHNMTLIDRPSQRRWLAAAASALCCPTIGAVLPKATTISGLTLSYPMLPWCSCLEHTYEEGIARVIFHGVLADHPHQIGEGADDSDRQKGRYTQDAAAHASIPRSSIIRAEGQSVPAA
jgi:hypothetical protein